MSYICCISVVFFKTSHPAHPVNAMKLYIVCYYYYLFFLYVFIFYIASDTQWRCKVLNGNEAQCFCNTITSTGPLKCIKHYLISRVYWYLQSISDFCYHEPNPNPPISKYHEPRLGFKILPSCRR